MLRQRESDSHAAATAEASQLKSHVLELELGAESQQLQLQAAEQSAAQLQARVGELEGQVHQAQAAHKAAEEAGKLSAQQLGRVQEELRRAELSVVSLHESSGKQQVGPHLVLRWGVWAGSP